MSGGAWAVRLGGSPSLIDQADDLALLREPVQLLLGEDERAVIGHLEYAAAGRLQGQVGDLAPVGADKLFRQTDGVRQVVSEDAELNGDLHVMPPVIKYCIYSSMGSASLRPMAGDSPATDGRTSRGVLLPSFPPQPQQEWGPG